MQKLTFKNSKNEEFIIEYSQPFMLQNLVGLSNTNNNLLSTKGYLQDGESDAGSFLGPRVISFSVIVSGTNDTEIFENRRKLIKFLNLKETFEVIYENNYIRIKLTCRIDGPPNFLSTQANPGDPKQQCTISLRLDNPYLFDVSESLKVLSIVEPQFHFPLIFSPSMTLSTLVSKYITITNIGDVETTVRIQFHGATTNPIITNTTTGEYVKVNKVIASDEVLEINTEYGKKKVEIIKSDGSRENAFQYIDLSSVFWSLRTGDNVITYDADSGADSAQVYIYYSNKYVGV